MGWISLTDGYSVGDGAGGAICVIGSGVVEGLGNVVITGSGVGVVVSITGSAGSDVITGKGSATVFI